MKYPFLISIPHGGNEIPEEVSSRLALLPEEVSWYCDPATRILFDFGQWVESSIDTPISRMVIDLNRPPLPLPPGTRMGSSRSGLWTGGRFTGLDSFPI